MNTVPSTTRGQPRFPKVLLRHWVWWLLGVLGIAGLVVGGWWGRAAQRVAVKDHWDAVGRGRAYLRHGRPDLAVQAIQDVRDEAPGSGEAMEVAGLALIRLGEYRGARQALDRALQLQPKQFDAAVALAELNFALGNGRRGIEALEQAVQLRPREFRLWLTMGKVLHDLGDHPKAIEAYEQAVALRPDDRKALVGLIRSLVRTGQSDKAAPLVAQAARAFPDDPEIQGSAARAALEANRLDEAISSADAALRHDPQNLDALLARARARVLQSRWEPALPDAERAAAAWPNDLGALQLLLAIENRLGLKDRAALTQSRRERARKRVELMNQLGDEIASHPEDPQVVWKIGRTSEESGSLLLASRCYQAALALDPSFQPARESLQALRAAHPDLVRSDDRSNPVYPGMGFPSSSPSP
jgi:tetratricopeptide (TPR) repeat protein